MKDIFKRYAAKAMQPATPNATTLKSTEATEKFKAMVLSHAAQVKADAAPAAPAEKLAPGWQRTSLHFIEKRSA